MGTIAGTEGTGTIARGPLTSHYRRMAVARAGLLEGVGAAEFTEDGIKERVESAADAMHEVVRDYLGDQPELHQLVKQAVANGAVGLRTVAAGNEATLRDQPSAVAHVEVIVRMDGSRPSFMIRDGEPDLKTSPAGSWKAPLLAGADEVRKVIACVGRIDDPTASQGFVGTGFLVDEDLIITNRHVLQEIAVPAGAGWELRPGISIDFGHEFRARASVKPRALTEVVFAGNKPITDPIDHRKLDLALIRLKKSNASNRPTTVLSVDVSTDWPAPGAEVYIIGYPGSPELGAYPLNVLEQLFQSTFGCKRLAPGAVTPPFSAVAPWTVAHDSTTLGGNSGSVVVVVGREYAAAGLHYGGKGSDPRENWGHVLGRVLKQKARGSRSTLRQVLEENGVTLVDRTITDH